MSFRNATVPLTPEQWVEVGQMVRTRRLSAKRGLKALGSVTGLSLGHISRFERGKRPIAWSRVEKMAADLELDPADLIAVARRLPPAVADSLAVPGLAHALVGDGYRLPVPTRLALRRLSIGARVESICPPPARRGDLPDPAAALAERGYRIAHVAEWTGLRVEIASPLLRITEANDATTERFLLAHALGHLLLDTTDCDITALSSDSESDATTFASYFLMPARQLSAELATVPAGLDMRRAGDFGALLQVVAGGLQVPEWLLAWRLAIGEQLPGLAGVPG